MIAFVDVDYRDAGAIAACVIANDWGDASPVHQFVETIARVEDYIPGEFYRRELPCLLAVLGKSPTPIDIVVVDGFVWLGQDHPGLGAHLYEALNRNTVVVGVAKTRFRSADGLAIPVKHGGSASPLWITAAGMDPVTACQAIQQMHGEFRIPTLIKLADQLCRKA